MSALMNFIHRASAAVKTLFHTISPSCRDAIRLQSEALDRPLSMSARMGLRLHLLLCRWCRRYGKQIRFLQQAARHCDTLTETAPARLSPEACERLKRSIREASD